MERILSTLNITVAEKMNNKLSSMLNNHLHQQPEGAPPGNDQERTRRKDINIIPTKFSAGGTSAVFTDKMFMPFFLVLSHAVFNEGLYMLVSAYQFIRVHIFTPYLFCVDGVVIAAQCPTTFLRSIRFPRI